MWLRRLVVLMTLGLALVFSFMELRMAWRYVSSLSWPSTQGELLLVDYGNGGKSYLRTKYIYEVEGRRYENGHLNVEGEHMIFGSYNHKHAELSRRKLRGMPVEVFYNPSRPQEAFLFRGFPNNIVTHTIFLIFFCHAVMMTRQFRRLWFG